MNPNITWAGLAKDESTGGKQRQGKGWGARFRVTSGVFYGSREINSSHKGYVLGCSTANVFTPKNITKTWVLRIVQFIH